MELHLDQCARASKDTGTEGSDTTSARTRLGWAGLATLELENPTLQLSNSAMSTLTCLAPVRRGKRSGPISVPKEGTISRTFSNRPCSMF